jgi:hypothetical protein
MFHVPIDGLGLIVRETGTYSNVTGRLFPVIGDVRKSSSSKYAIL